MMVDYIIWHYGRALGSYVRLVRNGRDFILYYFSIPLLLRTLLSPYKRITEQHTKRFDFEDWAGSIIINTLSRIIGLIIRLIIIFIGLVVFVGFMILSVIGFGIWIASPLITLMSIIIGVLILAISL